MTHTPPEPTDLTVDAVIAELHRKIGEAYSRKPSSMPLEALERAMSEHAAMQAGIPPALFTFTMPQGSGN